MKNLIAFLAVALILTASAIAQRPGGRRGPSAEQRKKMLKKYDLNGDGKLDAEELKKARADRGGRGRGRGPRTGDKPGGETDKPRTRRPRGNKPGGETDRPRGRRPRGNKPGGETDKPRGETDKPRTRRPRGNKPGESRRKGRGPREGEKPSRGKGTDKRPAESSGSGHNL